MNKINRRDFIIQSAIVATSVVSIPCMASAATTPKNQKGSSENDIFFTDVPFETYDIILGRLTGSSVTASVLAYRDLFAHISYGTKSFDHDRKTESFSLEKGTPRELIINTLLPDTAYYYRLNYVDPASNNTVQGAEGTFHTVRGKKEGFTFTIQADSHLDHNTNPEIYKQTLINAGLEHPDFHMALGDTFMNDKYRRNFKDSHKQYLAQRYYLGQLCHSAPLFFVLGNHDGEKGEYSNKGQNEMSVWSANTRKKYIPNPFPGDFYKGNEDKKDSIGLLGDYYSWEWGESLFMVLDPYWYTVLKKENKDGWRNSLGKAQYSWLKTTLESSRAKFKFIFIHNLVGGTEEHFRGGVEMAKYFEWGGYDLDGTYGFDEQRPGWGKPLHRIFVENKVSMVFHGHDHFYARQDLEGVIYQLVPQPGHRGYGSTGSAKDYGYLNGDIIAGTGFLKIKISDQKATVDFIKSVLPQDEKKHGKNRDVAFSYSVTA